MIVELFSLAKTWWSSELAAISEAVGREILAVSAAIVTLSGVTLCWRAPRHRMSIEEGAKDGIFTEHQARRKIEFMAWFGPAVAIIGCALLGFAVLR